MQENCENKYIYWQLGINEENSRNAKEISIDILSRNSTITHDYYFAIVKTNEEKNYI